MIRKRLIDKFGEHINHMSCVYLRDGERHLRSFFDPAKKLDTIIEIGTYQGVSAAVLSEYAKEVHTIDIENLPLRNKIFEYLNIKNIKFHLVKDRKNEDKIISEIFKNNNVDLCFIDGEHFNGQLDRDFENCKRCNNIIIHDYAQSFPQVFNFVNSLKGYKKDVSDVFVKLTKIESKVKQIEAIEKPKKKIQKAEINKNIIHEGDRMHAEFKYIEKWLYTEEFNGQKRFKNGVDIGCGTNRLANDGDLPGHQSDNNGEIKSTGIISIDQQGDPRYASAQLVWNCENLELFKDNIFDFIFSSHCLEDFQNISMVFENWWRKIKLHGLMILLLPDMEDCNCQHCKGKSRYPKVGEPNGNPAHRTNITKEYIQRMLTGLLERNKIKYEILQMDTIPHNESCSIDFVIKKL